MVLSRFWYLVLSLVAGAAIGAALLAHGIFNRQVDVALEDALRRDRREIEAALKLEARAQIDQTAAFAADGDLRSILRNASARTTDNELGDLNRRLKERLNAVNSGLRGYAGDIVFGVDRQGIIIAQLGPNSAKFGAGIGTFPLVDRALSGYLRDDAWVYDGQAYRMAARPIIEGGQYVGAIVHGKRYDQELCERLSRRLDGATVGFFRADQMLSTYAPADVAGAPSQADVSSHLRDVGQDAKLLRGEVTDAFDVQGRARAIYSLVTGSASSLQVGYVVSRPRHALASPTQIFERATNDDVREVPWPLVATVTILLFILGMLFVWLERDRPMSRLRKAAAELGQRKLDRFDLSRFGGGYRKIAEGVNQALEKVAEQGGIVGGAPKPANLDALLGPTPGDQGPSFFAFANPGENPAELSIPPSAPPEQLRMAPMPQLPKVPAVPQIQSPPPAPPPIAAPPSPPTPVPSAAPMPPLPPLPTPPSIAPEEAPESEAPPPVPPPPAAPAAATTTPATPLSAPSRPQAAPGTSVSAHEGPTVVANRSPQQSVPVIPAPGSGPAKPVPRPMPAPVGGKPGAAAAPAPGTPPLPSRPQPGGAPKPAAAAAPPGSGTSPGGLRKATILGMPPAGGAETTGTGTKVVVDEQGGNDEGATMITQVPESLIQQTASGSFRAVSDDQAEDIHFREVFQQFVAMKKQCNEPVAGLTYEKFLTTLKKNKEQILTKHGGKRVRFSVYEKDGKAALKATPVKE